MRRRRTPGDGDETSWRRESEDPPRDDGQALEQHRAVLYSLGAYRATREGVRRAAKGNDAPAPFNQELGILTVPHAKGLAHRPGWPSLHDDKAHQWWAEVEQDGKIFLVNKHTGEVLATKSAPRRAPPASLKEER